MRITLTNVILHTVVAAIWIIHGVPIAAADAAETSPGRSVDYLTQVKPILAARCYACHGALKQKGNLRLDTVAAVLEGGDSGAAVEAGKPAESYLIERINEKDDAFRMPPDGKPLSPDEISLIQQWIADGAVAPENDAPEKDPATHWSYQPLKRPELPLGVVASNPIDAFLNAAQASRGLTATAATDKATLLRRVTFDLIGLPPTPTELQEFLADTSPQAYQTVVDRLLASPRYGERWGRHWMDVWRYSDWYGRRGVPDVMNSYPQIWRWRDWIIRSLNEDKGYDRMVVEMLAADEIAPDDQENIVATGFIVRNWFKWNYDTWMRDQVEHTGKAFLGMSFNCALCHDHKYDPITQEEAFRFRAIFEPLELRHDRVAGEPDPGVFQKYVYAKSYGPISSGMIRVFDEKLDAETLMYSGGDQRNLMKGKSPVPPGVPAFLGGDQFEFAPIELPVTTWNPGIREFVQKEEIAKRKAVLTTAEGALASARTSLLEQLPSVTEALKTAEASLEAAIVAGAAIEPKSAALSGAQSLLLDARQGRRVLAHKLTDVPAIEGPAIITYQIRILDDAHFNLQLGLDIESGATGGWVGFEKGKILTYQPGGFTQVEAGHFELADGKRTFDVTMELDIPKNQFALTVVRVEDRAKLVDRFPAALNGWTGTNAAKQGMFIDARPGTRVLIDDIVFRPGMGDPWLKFSFEPPQFPVGQDVADRLGWMGSATFSQAPATSLVIRFLEASPEITKAEQQVKIAASKVDALELAVKAAEMQVAAAKADLDVYQRRVAADIARYIDESPGADAVAMSAAAAERQMLFQKAEASRLAAAKVLADAEALPVADTNRTEALTKASQQLNTATTAAETARANLAKTDATYSPLGPIYPRTSTGRRTALANWIVSPTNPLTARVAVNHLWQRHFGRPLVETPSNFGRNGQAPTHPELLDWLAVELQDNNWSMKHLHRLIVTSAAYQRDSHAAPDHPGFTVDPENRALWRFVPSRLEAEVIRDSIFAVAGELDTTMGGPELDQELGLTSHRRSLYFSHHGEKRMEFLELFDEANPTECYERTTSILPQQALALSNSELTHIQAKKLAGLLTGEVNAKQIPPDKASLTFVEAAFERILSRQPTEQERDISQRFLKRQQAVFVDAQGTDTALQIADPVQRARESFVHALLNHNDFVTVR